MEFYKYQGTGNDFILIDDAVLSFQEEDTNLVKRLCDRRFGIGADGLMLLRKHPDYDFEMIYYNSDGNKSTMCGNGGRCIVAFAKFQGWIEDKAQFLAVDGLHTASIKDDMVTLSMIDVENIETYEQGIFLNTGSPHVVQFVSGIETLDVKNLGAQIRYDSQFAPGGANVNFVELISSDEFRVRTYERGVEDETLSCGTGVVASAIASFLSADDPRISSSATCNVHTQGGRLTVTFESDPTKSIFTNVQLIGPAIQVFKGEIPVNFV